MLKQGHALLTCRPALAWARLAWCSQVMSTLGLKMPSKSVGRCMGQQAPQYHGDGRGHSTHDECHCLSCNPRAQTYPSIFFNAHKQQVHA